MKNKQLKKSIISLVMTGSFILGIGAFNQADAQDWRRGRQQRRGEVESTGNIDRNRNGIDDRYETRDGRVDMNRNGIADQDENFRRYGRQGYYGNNRGYNNNDYYYNRGYYGDRGYNLNNSEFQQGYRDGLSRGRDDALTNRAMTPNNSSHYRNGNASYRAGFERGFFEAYRQYSGRRW